MTLLAVVLALTVSPWFLLLARLRRRQPVALCAGRRLSRVPGARSHAVLPTIPASAGAPDRRRGRPDRTARPLDRQATSGSSSSSGRSSRSASARSRRGPSTPSRAPAGRPRARNPSPRDSAIDASFAGQGGYALMVAVHGSGQPRRDRRRGEPPARVRLPRVLGRRRRRSRRTVGRSLLSGGAAASPTEMVRAADDLKGKLADLSHGSTTVSLTGAPGMWSDFNEANKSAMLKSEIISWPVTLAILLLAFGSLVAAGLPAPPHDPRADGLGRQPVPDHAPVRRVDLVDELRAHVRARARHRLRALHRRPLPRRPLRLAGARRATRWR